MGTIKVLGQGDLKFIPDVTRVTVDIDALHSTYNDAFEAGAKNTSHIKDILAEHGFDRDIAKTSRFDVSMHRVHKKMDRGEWQWVVKGYKINQRFTIELEMGCPQLTALLDQIGREIVGVEIEFGFAVSDTDSARLKVIEAAVKDAQRKAEVMATTLGKRLGEVSNVNYGVPRDNYYDGRLYGDCIGSPTPMGDGTPIDITPTDLNGYANVEVVWELV
ncbi:MAG: SIMPL domain-containing protein [Tidjanibacter sp.]|nr:SIMPL domain-containing protein [Tidjanibacter sp.]